MDITALTEYVSQFSVGCPAKIARLSFILEKAPLEKTKRAASQLLVQELKETINITAHNNIFKKPVIQEHGFRPDEMWIQNTERNIHIKMERLESDLATAKSAMVKESIRLAHFDLGCLHLQTGNLSEALKSFTRSREFCSTPRQMLDCNAQLVLVSMDLEQYFSANSHLQKIATNLSPDGLDPSLLAQLRCCSALCSLHDKQFKTAALKFLEVGDATDRVASLRDLSLYSSILCCATLDRGEIRSLVMDRKHLLTSVLSAEPLAKNVLLDFFDGRYGSCLSGLSDLDSRLCVDIHLARHRDSLVQLIRERVVQQYCLPFCVVRLDRMQTCLQWDRQTLDQAVEDQAMKGRLQDLVIDREHHLLVRRRSHTTTSHNVVRLGTRRRNQVGRDLLRICVLEQGLVVDREEEGEENSSNRDIEFVDGSGRDVEGEDGEGEEMDTEH